MLNNFNFNKKLTRQTAIRLKCLDCCAGQSGEVRACTCDDCPLYPYRLSNHSPSENELADCMKKIKAFFEKMFENEEINEDTDEE